MKNRLLNLDKIIYQDDDWFKFSLDSVLLAHFVTLNLKTKKVIDFATGNAPIPILLTYRTKALIYGVEYQECIYNLARDSIFENFLGDKIKLICDDVNNLDSLFSSDSFDVVTCNPPYFKTKYVEFLNDNIVKALARHEITLCLDDVLMQANYLLKTGGIFAMVHRTERFVEIIEKMKKYKLEPKRVRFVYPKEDKDSDLVLIEGIKNGRPGLKLLPPLIVYQRNGDYTKEISEMLNFKD